LWQCDEETALCRKFSGLAFDGVRVVDESKRLWQNILWMNFTYDGKTSWISLGWLLFSLKMWHLIAWDGDAAS
jgi:hypothetical protein